MNKIIYIILSIIFVLIMSIIGLFIYEMVEFYNDYKCSTTSDINYYIDNKCMRFRK